MKHAKLSPSASSRWMNCPGSVALCEKIAQKPNNSATRGSVVHKVGELLLENKKVNINDKISIDNSGKNYSVSQDMLIEAEDYCNYIDDLVGDNGILEIEFEVNLQFIAKDQFGHADAIVIRDGILHVCDLKTGSINVNAKDNSQLLLYASGAFLELKDYYDIESIKLHIIQDNAKTSNTNSCDVTLNELNKFIEKVTLAAKEALKPNAICIPGDTQCRWCHASSICTALNTHIVDLFDNFNDFDNAIDKVDNVSIDKVVDFVKHEDMIKKLLIAYKERIEDELRAGTKIEDFKLVEKRTRLMWRDDIDIAVYFDHIYKDKINQLAPRKIVTPTQFKKIIGVMDTDEYKNFNDMTRRNDGVLTVVSVNDKRPAVTTSDYFEDLN